MRGLHSGQPDSAGPDGGAVVRLSPPEKLSVLIMDDQILPLFHARPFAEPDNRNEMIKRVFVAPVIAILLVAGTKLRLKRATEVQRS